MQEAKDPAGRALIKFRYGIEVGRGRERSNGGYTATLSRSSRNFSGCGQLGNLDEVNSISSTISPSTSVLLCFSDRSLCPRCPAPVFLRLTVRDLNTTAKCVITPYISFTYHNIYSPIFFPIFHWIILRYIKIVVSLPSSIFYGFCRCKFILDTGIETSLLYIYMFHQL